MRIEIEYACLDKTLANVIDVPTTWSKYLPISKIKLPIFDNKYAKSMNFCKHIELVVNGKCSISVVLFYLMVFKVDFISIMWKNVIQNLNHFLSTL